MGDISNMLTELEVHLHTAQEALVWADGRIKELEADRAAMIEAINDAIRRPLGVVPESAEQWYIPL